MANTPRFLDSQRLIVPDGHDSPVVTLAHGGLLDTLTTLYTVLVTVFQETEIGQQYKRSPYIERFLWAFSSCPYLREAGFFQPPTMNLKMAEQTVMALNQRLSAWQQSLKQPTFTDECYRHRRNSLKNYRRFTDLIQALFACYSRLMVLRVDLSYTQQDTPYIDYATARFHREQLSHAFTTHPLFTDMVGYAWKLEWRPEKGFHYHMLFFFDGHRCQRDILHAQQIGEFWKQSITGAQGLYYNCNLDAENRYKNNAMGIINYHDIEKQQGLADTAKYLSKIDEYAALLVTGRTTQTSKKPVLPEGPGPGRPRQFMGDPMPMPDA
ncbi:inovirus-type Gp2 protein [Halomonas vilamensis]|uniref:Inovirus-type Gp2 protein n=1 Tax=Vreelandella vilamensis TaxID=531309 RepID=A0ABU1H7X5_9GAMM|nr:inovirus-type Gp2 protein [Halomonas vilamensis]MDR5900324.1 inovirus-type Gp2 protein [Halomonas vilamensis]